MWSLPGYGISQIPAPIFNHDSGFFDAEEFTLMLASPIADAEIFYTLDGSDPNPFLNENFYPILNDVTSDVFDTLVTQTHLYEEPLNFHYEDLPDNEIERINTYYRFTDFLPDEEPFRAIVVRAVSFIPGQGVSEVANATYFLHPNARDLFDLPVFSIITDPKNLFSYEDGIYVGGKIQKDWIDENPNINVGRWVDGNFKKAGEDWERISHVHYFENNILELDQKIGVRIHGNNTRSYRRKSLRLYARSDYGENTLNHQFFPELNLKGDSNQPANEFKRLILRTSGQDGGNDPHESYGFGETSTQIRDGLSQMVMSHYNSVEYQHYRPAVHFINGVYWGIINMRERHDHWYFSQHYDLDREDLIILTNEHLYHGEEEDINDYFDLRSLIRSTARSSEEIYEEVEQRVDLESLTYYNIGNLYIGHSYWPDGGTDDTRYWRKRVDPLESQDVPFGHDGKWRWMWKDMDKSFSNPERDMYEQLDENFSVHRDLTQFLWNQDEYRNTFLITLANEMNTTFHTDRLMYWIDSYHNRIETELPRHAGRWNTGDDEPTVFRNFAKDRPDIFAEQTAERFDLNGYSEITFDVNNPAGQLTIGNLTLDNSDARFSGNHFSYPWNGTYFHEVPLTISSESKDESIFLQGWIINQDTLRTSQQHITILPDTVDFVEALFKDKITFINSPQITFPVNESISLGDSLFTWTESGEADFYLIQIADTPSFLNVTLQDTTELLQYVVNPIIYEGEFYWRVRAEHDDVVSEWSEISSFSFIRETLAIPEPISPEKEEVVSEEIQFVWSNVEHAEDYLIQISEEDSFNELITEDSTSNSQHTIIIRELYEDLYWRVRARNQFGVSDWSEPVLFTNMEPSNISEPDIPGELVLYQNYPNPFNPVTRISFYLPKQTHVSITVYNSLGQRVQVITDQLYGQGLHSINFDGSSFTSGVYLYKLQTNETTQIKRMTILK